ncbi:uncharacterized protein LOC126722451 isoform X2 [Quercus robur]|uniref:uncharacterized protein LOC126722451 isoform X2 n=1 Tax=Quercus robur TaxID=38942 RepID=UPI0021611BDA|nr:uncharacterized protein LOC126722451 isoform X2 [Quercus robur]
MIRRCRPPLVSFRCKRPLLRPTKLPRPVVENAPFVLPINIRCNTCSQYIYQGTHLAVYKEEVLDERYLDFECCLICLKCTNCSAKIWIRSDPENRDYFVESGATKKRQAAVSKKPNYQVAVSKKRKREAEEGGDALKSLENTTLGSKIEIAALDEMKSMESQHAAVSADAMLEDLPAKAAKKILALWGAAKYVENRTLDSKREIAALDEMKSLESQHATVSADSTLEE